MAVFPTLPLTPSRTTTVVRSASRRRPFLYFGLPFVFVVVASSFGLSTLTQTRYDLRDTKVNSVSKEEALHMNKNRKKIDIREEYFRLQAKDVAAGKMSANGTGKGKAAGAMGGDADLDDWDNKRIQRLPGQAEWGSLPSR